MSNKYATIVFFYKYFLYILTSDNNKKTHCHKILPFLVKYYVLYKAVYVLDKILFVGHVMVMVMVMSQNTQKIINVTKNIME